MSIDDIFRKYKNETARIFWLLKDDNVALMKYRQRHRELDFRWKIFTRKQFMYQENRR